MQPPQYPYPSSNVGPPPPAPKRNPWRWYRSRGCFLQGIIGCVSLFVLTFVGFVCAVGTPAFVHGYITAGTVTPTTASQVLQPTATSTPTTASTAPTNTPTSVATGTTTLTPIPTATQAPTPTHAAPTQSPFIPESLAFQGDVPGNLTKGINPAPLTHDNPTPNYVQRPDGSYFDPAPTLTQCSDFSTMAGQDYMAVIVGTIGPLRYTIAVEINEDNAAYIHPGTELRPGNVNTGGSVEVYETGGKSRRWMQTYGPATQEPVIVLHADRRSGTVDTWLINNDLGQKSSPATLYIHGTWRCG